MLEDEERRRLVGMIQQGLQSDFWRWYAVQMRAESQADVLSITDPTVPANQVEFLRGKLRARNDDLLLPQQALAAYDIVDHELAEAELDTPGAPRRLSPLPDEAEWRGQPPLEE